MRPAPRRFFWTDRAGRVSAPKLVALVAALLPACWIAGGMGLGLLGPKPVTAALRETGDWALRFLLAALAVSPLRRLIDYPRLILARRILGVAAFAYAAMHLALYVADQGFDLARVASEIVLRLYLTIGFVTLAGLAGLAATSTDGMVRRLGSARWNRLHRLVHVLAALALVHVFMQVRADAHEATWMAGLALLLGLQRLAHRLGQPTEPGRFALLALAAGLATMIGEALWYGLATGIGGGRILAANLDPAVAPRPALVVAAIGLSAALAAWLRRRSAPRLEAAGHTG